MVPELSVSNFAASLKFYCDILGFKIRHQRKNPDFAYLQNEQVQIMLEQIHDAAWITDDLTYPLGRGINFQIELSDIFSIYERLKAANIPCFRDLQENSYDTGNEISQQAEFLVQDPDGYLLRFSQFIGIKTNLTP